MLLDQNKNLTLQILYRNKCFATTKLVSVHYNPWSGDEIQCDMWSLASQAFQCVWLRLIPRLPTKSWVV